MLFHLNELGKDFDFVMLDTAHYLPGEILDFLVILQLLTEDAIVCLHDVACHQAYADTTKHATGVLFSAVSAEKFLNFIPNNTRLSAWNFPKIFDFTYPNIAAFKINRHTKENILDVFCALMLRWNYMPSELELKRYDEYISTTYGETAYKIFKEALKANRINLEISNKYRPLHLIPKNSKVIVYSSNAEIFSYITDRDLEFEVLPISDVIDLSKINYFVCSRLASTATIEIYSRLLHAGFNENRIIII